MFRDEVAYFIALLPHSSYIDQLYFMQIKEKYMVLDNITISNRFFLASLSAFENVRSPQPVHSTHLACNLLLLFFLSLGIYKMCLSIMMKALNRINQDTEKSRGAELQIYEAYQKGTLFSINYTKWNQWENKKKKNTFFFLTMP